jgi:hypothetical protein
LALDCEPGPGGFKFIWKPAQPTLPPPNLPTASPRPLYLTVGEVMFRKTGQSKMGGTPGSVCAGSLRAGLCRPGFELIKNIFHKPPKFGLTAPFLRGCPPREMRAPLQAAPLGPRCLMVKDARYRPAHGCVVRGVVPLRGPPVEFTRSGAWGVCFWGFSREIGSEISRICLSFGVLAYCIRRRRRRQGFWGFARVVFLLVHRYKTQYSRYTYHGTAS